MLTFKQYLNEVLNNPYKWEFDAKKPGPDGENELRNYVVKK